MSRIYARKWPDNVDPTKGKRIGVVTYWKNSSGLIDVINFDGTVITDLPVDLKNLMYCTSNSCLIEGEEVELNIADIDTQHPFAINVSGPNNSQLQCNVFEHKHIDQKFYFLLIPIVFTLFKKIVCYGSDNDFQFCSV
jgi:hypothetical protein